MKSRIATLSLLCLCLSCARSPFDASTSIGKEVLDDVDPSITDFGSRAAIDTASVDIIAASSFRSASSGLHAGDLLFIGQWPDSGEYAKSYIEFSIDTTIITKFSVIMDTRLSAGITACRLILKNDTALYRADRSALQTISVSRFPGERTYSQPIDSAVNQADILPVANCSLRTNGESVLFFDTGSVFVKDLKSALDSLKAGIPEMRRLDTLMKAIGDSAKTATARNDTALARQWSDSLATLNETKSDVRYKKLRFVLSSGGRVMSFINKNGMYLPHIDFAYNPTADTFASVNASLGDYSAFEPAASYPGRDGRTVSSTGADRRVLFKIDFSRLYDDARRLHARGVLKATLPVMISHDGIHDLPRDSIPVSLSFYYSLGTAPDTALNLASWHHSRAIAKDSTVFYIPVEDSLWTILSSADHTGYCTIRVVDQFGGWSRVQWEVPDGNIMKMETVFLKQLE